MDRLFLDANVLFSAAYRPSSRILQLWNLGDVELVTSHYAVGEARRNLSTAARRDQLDDLLATVEVISLPTNIRFQISASLPEKDRPILVAAIRTGATHLITGDFRHFGKYYGQTVDGVLIMSPAKYLATR